MKNTDVEVIKSSGEKTKFSLEKLKKSLQNSGADKLTIDYILDKVRDELYQGISTKEIYNRAFALLKKKKSIFASKYKLKKAIYELGPTGFPFERFIATILEHSGYQVEVGKIIQGECVSHEVDVVAKNGNDYVVIECKFHGEEGRNCNVKIPLYIHSRYQDILANYKTQKPDENPPRQGWVVTNTRFTSDALDFGLCAGLYLLSWDFPEDNSLKNMIVRSGLYPITVSTILTNREKQFLLSRDIVLCKQLIDDVFYLDHLGVSEARKERILKEFKMLCNA